MTAQVAEQAGKNEPSRLDLSIRNPAYAKGKSFSYFMSDRYLDAISRTF
jgi:hypothetical protein